MLGFRSLTSCCILAACSWLALSCSQGGGDAPDQSVSPDADSLSSEVEILEDDVLVEDFVGEETVPLDVEVELVPELPPVKACEVDGECNDGNPCTKDRCEPDYGCVHTPKDCSDGNECTLDGCTPADGKCTHAAVDCTDDNLCTVESCDPAVGCVFAAKDCDDDDPCTADGCSPQAGCASKPMQCDDGNPCTIDSCSAPDGCKHQPSPDPDCCVADFQCNDGLPCTLDQCKAYACVFEAIPGLTCCKTDDECKDDNECTEDVCLEGLCQQFAAGPGCCMASEDCFDGDGCTTDKCVDHFCVYDNLAGCCHEDKECDDGEACTTDVCQLAGGDAGFCENKAVLDCCHGDDKECDDGNVCTVDDCPGVGQVCAHDWKNNCCLATLDCDDTDKCTKETCIDNVCGHENICCKSDKECDDGDDLCTKDLCVDDFCFHEPTGAPGCCNMPLFEDDFSTDKGWKLDTTWEKGPTKVSAGQQYAGPDPANDHTGSTDNIVAGVKIGDNAPTDIHDWYWLTSPDIDAKVGGAVVLSYWRWLNSDYEPFMTNGVEVFDGGGWVSLWQTAGSPGAQDTAWTYVELDVTPYANASFKVRFGYKIGSGGVFSVASWNVDDVKVYQEGAALCCDWASDCQTEDFPEAQCKGGACFLGECAQDKECDDLNACTSDKCSGGQCVQEWIAGCCLVPQDCDDGLPCTADSCANNKCSHTPIPACCAADGECGDGNACTTDKCTNNKCTNTPIPACCLLDGECGDGNACTDDVCTNNKCSHTPVPDCCLLDGECDDSDACTTDKCVGNACDNAPIPDCCNLAADCDDGLECSVDTCSAQHVCEHDKTNCP